MGLWLVGILVILSLSVAIFNIWFYPVRDTLVGYPTIKLKNKEWITSQYGTPLLKFLLPKVLRRVKTEKGGALRFSSGNYDGLLSISIWYLQKTAEAAGRRSSFK